MKILCISGRYSLNVKKHFSTALCRFLSLFLILYMTQRSNFLTNRTIISSLHKLSPGKSLWREEINVLLVRKLDLWVIYNIFLCYVIMWFTSLSFCLLGWWIICYDKWSHEVWDPKDNEHLALLGTFPPFLSLEFITHDAKVINVICFFGWHIFMFLWYIYACFSY